MNGFFEMNDIDIVQPTKAKKLNPKVKKEIYTCEGCGLYKQCNGKLDYVGEGREGILVVLEQATTTSDRLQNPLTGETKHIITDLCKKAQLSLQDVWVVNSIRCIGKRNKATVPACRGLLKQTIAELKPRSIITIGPQALDVLIGDMTSVGGSGKKKKEDKGIPTYKWDGRAIPFHEYMCYIYPTYGIKDLIKSRYNKVVELKMTRQFIAAKKGDTYVDYTIKPIEILTSIHDIKNVLLTMETEKIVAFDYETTGIQPYKKGHEIICMSVATSRKAYAFENTKAILPYIQHFLTSDVPKVMHNAKYELIWSKELAKVDVNNVIADTMLIAHSIDNTPGTVGLKPQTFFNFGVAGYDDTIAPLLKAKDKSVHSFNSLYYMKQQGELTYVMEELLTYCAFDSLYTIWLYEKQLEQILPHMQQGIDIFLEATKVFAEIEYRGMRIDIDIVRKNIKLLTLKMQELKEQIYATEEVKAWNRETEFNFNSNKDMGVLLYEILGYTPYKETSSGANSTDKEALEKIIEKEGSEFLVLLLEYKKLVKMRDTYLVGLESGTLDGYIRPSFNLHTVQTFRSCLVGNTPISTINDTIPIKDVFIGTHVMCVDENNKIVHRKVIWSGLTGRRKVIKLKLIYADCAEKTLLCTEEHKLRCSDGTYIQAQDSLGHVIKGETINYAVMAIEALPDKVDVYDIEVEELHNFFANGICVHNSSSNPNFQNVPKRDKLASTMIRSAFIPDEGAFIEELDFSSLEVNISQCYNQDKNLLKYLTDPSHNMHTDSACDIFLRTKETMLKEERRNTKGGFVFAQSYGSTFKNCAKNMWDNMGQVSKKHLASKGCVNLDKFTDIVEEAEYQFWNVRFKRWGQWKKENWSEYLKKGYIDTYTGFRLNALMGSTQASNAAIQGSATHCLLFVLMFLHIYTKQLGLKSRIIGQIHDSIVLNLFPEEEEIIHKIVKLGLDRLRDEWKWVTVQLTMDYEQTPVNGDWSQLEEKGEIRSK